MTPSGHLVLIVSEFAGLNEVEQILGSQSCADLRVRLDLLIRLGWQRVLSLRLRFSWDMNVGLEVTEVIAEIDFLTWRILEVKLVNQIINLAIVWISMD